MFVAILVDKFQQRHWMCELTVLNCSFVIQVMKSYFINDCVFLMHFWCDCLELRGPRLRLKFHYSTVALVPPMSTMYIWRGIT